MVLVNGVERDEVPARDRGLAYGDGVFRTLRAENGSPRCWPWHYRKLRDDCAALAIACPDERTLTDEVTRLSRTQGDAIIKIIVTRGEGSRGYAIPPGATSTRIVLTAPLPIHPARYYEEGIEARICELRLAFQPRLAGIKHLNRLENVLARGEWSDPEIAEGLLLDNEGNVVQATMSNLFMIENEVFATPDLSRCGVAGVQRARVLSAAEARGVTVTVEKIQLERLLAADELFVVNSGFGVWQIRRIGSREWGRGVLVPQVRRWLDEEN